MNRWLHAFTAMLFVLALATLAPPTSAQDDAKPGSPKAKDIDVVICLDVSGSMDGLIDSAKNKLWDIVNELAKIKPAPNLRVGLYSYGHNSYDAKIGWIRKDLDLTHDLDMLYQKLFALRTNGGTEYVTRVCRDAVRDLSWSKDHGALKVIFVCGNEPASQDPVVKLKEAADFAISRGVVINPIYCGNPDDGDARDWREFAALCGGRFASIDQNKSRVAIATPFDKPLAELGVKLNGTYVYYGKGGDEKAAGQKRVTQLSAAQGAPVAANRTTSQNSALYQGKNSAWDLVDKLKADPKLDITKLPDSELCEDLRKLKPAERVEYVKDMAAKREQLQKEISDLDAKRRAFIAEEMKRNPRPADRAFDAAINEALRTQAATKGIVIPKE
jgi:hypothetical protein